MCFVWISEQTPIISLYSNNRLVFVTQTVCVYCVVRTGYIYIYIHIYIMELHLSFLRTNRQCLGTCRAVNVSVPRAQNSRFKES